MSTAGHKLAARAREGVAVRAPGNAPELAAVEVEGMTREAFIVRGALAAGAAYGVVAVGPYVHSALAQTASADADIARFALTLELLEYEYYERAVKQVPNLSGEVRSVAKEIRDNELEHVDALQQLIAQLGGTPAKKLAVRFGDSFASESRFLTLAQTFEDTGVSAYNGAGPQIVSKDVLETAGEIVQIEARHAAVIRDLRGEDIAPSAFDASLDMAQVERIANPFIRGNPNPG
ncbi:MAG: ferritin-like domain-containing protein [Thermoleophilaceae bacterium]|nr:ferritin-like domain-containing protein [Thermoleophilaceae bacterium]